MVGTGRQDYRFSVQVRSGDSALLVRLTHESPPWSILVDSVKYSHSRGFLWSLKFEGSLPPEGNTCPIGVSRYNLGECVPRDPNEIYDRD